MNDKVVDMTYDLIHNNIELITMLAIIHNNDKELFNMIEHEITFNFNIIMGGKQYE